MCYQFLIAAGLQVLQGSKEQEAADEYAQVLGVRGDEEQGIARVRARKTREAGEEVAGAARADYAKAGVNVEAGSAGDVQDMIRRQAEEDALNEILYGRRKARALGEEARLVRAGGKAAMTSSVLSAGGMVARGWRRGGGTGTRGASGSGYTSDGSVRIE